MFIMNLKLFSPYVTLIVSQFAFFKILVTVIVVDIILIILVTITMISIFSVKN